MEVPSISNAFTPLQHIALELSISFGALFILEKNTTSLCYTSLAIQIKSYFPIFSSGVDFFLYGLNV